MRLPNSVSNRHYSILREMFISMQSIPDIGCRCVEMVVVKKSVAIHPIIDKYVRKTWALLVEEGYDATYSTAVNLMLLAAILEATKEEGLSERTRKLIWNFMEDEKTIKELNLQDQLSSLPKHIIVKVKDELHSEDDRIRTEKKM